MIPTPRTDEEVELINEDQLSDLDAYLTMMKHARQLERELAEQKRHAEDIYKASVELASMLEDKLAAERVLADSLADALRDIEGRACDATIMLHPDADTKGCVDDCWEWSEQALAAWKEARSGTI